MALRDQPYIPLYVQDFLTDEKLRECSAESVGVYIFLMCYLHKQEEYGTVLLKQTDKQTFKQTFKPTEKFAYKLAKHLPFDAQIISFALDDLLSHGVIQIEDDKLSQKRMVKDFELSNKRSLAGKKGGIKTQNFAKEFAKAKVKANSEYEYESESESENRIKDKGRGVGKPSRMKIPTVEEIKDHMRSKNGNLAESRIESEADGFFNYYESNGWKVGRNPMANWKASATNWINRSKQSFHKETEEERMERIEKEFLSGVKDEQ